MGSISGLSAIRSAGLRMRFRSPAPPPVADTKCRNTLACPHSLGRCRYRVRTSGIQGKR